MKSNDLITVDPDILGGAPVFKGTRVPVKTLFDYLEEHIKNNVRERGEFQLTSALDRLRKEDGFLGLIVDGQRFDIGLPEYYLDTLRAFSSPV